MHHYVLGKINEKNDDNSVLFMDHYLKAAEFLDSYGAIFPKHIIYTSPQYYSIEVLEVSTLYLKISLLVSKNLFNYKNTIVCIIKCFYICEIYVVSYFLLILISTKLY
jgi:hypothetical protein